MAVHFDVPNIDFTEYYLENLFHGKIERHCSCDAKPTNVIPRRNPDPGALNEGKTFSRRGIASKWARLE